MVKSDGGQALVVIAIAVAVLVAALAFAVDWGQAMAQRRVMQNVADATALGAGKYLASAVIWVSGAPAFSVSRESTWCVAHLNYEPQNRSFAPPGGTTSLEIDYWNGTTQDAQGNAIWTPTPTTSCPPTSSTPIPSDTIYVRAITGVTFSSLFASISEHSSSTAAASARVRLSGTPPGLIGGPMWAMVRHYKPGDFTNTCIVSPCDPTDPTNVQPKIFWDPNAPDVAYGNFKGLIDFSHDSPNFNSLNPAVQTRQLISQPDSWAHPPNPYANDQSGGCGNTWGAGLWDSWGQANANQDKQCSIQNWVYYGFRGTLKLDSHWSPLPAGWEGQEVPSSIGSRPAVCNSPPTPAPSCADSTLGDWVETAGGQTANLSSVLTKALTDLGSPSLPYSDKFIPGSSTVRFGKGLVILVFLWECAETFNKSKAAGDQWSLLGSASDCSQQISGTPDRVHLFTVAPFTVYQGTIGFGGGNNTVSGYWGGLFGSPDACQSCSLMLSNTAVLVPDN
ncbi:MAG: hypothetical protein AUH85_17380 [Chloroflexi bacterium 13_1_40CM_4_68_4]|nr:MAG: hypothetical protein AUH85_17380 [Chloroflexi bacterium 13_1_40CM_4_68_4]